ncbi:hypothetical protein, partial [Nonomuraea sp. NPDC002799]
MALITTFLAVTQPGAAAEARDPVPAVVAPPAGTEGAAVAAARRTGQPVEIESMRSETRQVFAKPDGT